VFSHPLSAFEPGFTSLFNSLFFFGNFKCAKNHLKLIILFRRIKKYSKEEFPLGG
jgi:hypothetical protein